ncbi:hypothetical protein SDJN03_06117, partial [Cucurbita argyrosperma subsp. sororia]
MFTSSGDRHGMARWMASGDAKKEDDEGRKEKVCDSEHVDEVETTHLEGVDEISTTLHLSMINDSEGGKITDFRRKIIEKQSTPARN